MVVVERCLAAEAAARSRRSGGTCPIADWPPRTYPLGPHSSWLWLLYLARPNVTMRCNCRETLLGPCIAGK